MHFEDFTKPRNPWKVHEPQGRQGAVIEFGGVEDDVTVHSKDDRIPPFSKGIYEPASGEPPSPERISAKDGSYTIELTRELSGNRLDYAGNKGNTGTWTAYDNGTYGGEE